MLIAEYRTAGEIQPRHATLGQIADGAVVHLTRPSRFGLKSSAAPPGYSAVVLADGSRPLLPNETRVAVLQDPIALDAESICAN
jgi:hypothetical protein